MTEPKSFLENLTNLRLVMSVALEHIQANLTPFVKDASANQLRQCDTSISQIRTLAEHLEREFNTLEYLRSAPPLYKMLAGLFKPKALVLAVILTLQYWVGTISSIAPPPNHCTVCR